MVKLEKYGKRFHLNLKRRKGWILAGFSMSKSMLRAWKNMGLV